jgi:hypothetical protein
MTTLCEMIMECRAIEGMDRLILYGWAAQLEEGNDTVFASKETVAETIGVSANTVRRRTQALIAAGWLLDTGEEKQWQLARTPVRIVNVQMIAEVPHQVDAVKNSTFTGVTEAPHQIAPHQNDAQGSYGSTGSLDLSCSSSLSFVSSTATGVPPVKETAALKSKESKEPKTLEPLEPRTLEPTPKPTPPPVADKGLGGNRSKRVCKDCGEPLLRGVNHLLTCSKALGLPPNQMGEADRQKRGESIAVERKAPPTATPDVSPRSSAPPSSGWSREFRCSSCKQLLRPDWTCGTEGCDFYEPEAPKKPKPIPQPAGFPKPIPLAAYLDDDIELSKYER